ncbi:dUTP diphosphatase [Oceanobacillus iheyensis]|uniref:dUTP diphosphatase n=1 Tax=Oceanobacillus iheyensis TaxID=182710 RepID=UPI003641C0AB
MDWQALFNMQKQLDSYIEENHGLEKADLFDKKILALLVELGELANETRCFKFWSKKPRNKQSVILEEYVDVIHFLMSVGINKGYDSFESTNNQHINRSEIDQFQIVYEQTIMYKNEPNKAKYEELFSSCIDLGNILGFSEEDIQRAYLEKNEINYKRQNQGY